MHFYFRVYFTIPKLCTAVASASDLSPVEKTLQQCRNVDHPSYKRPDLVILEEHADALAVMYSSNGLVKRSVMPNRKLVG